ncbi:MAG: hypothetical protein B6I20_04000, partial [Bacteroidetes bacterium 4572_117]
TLPAPNRKALVDFQKKVAETSRKVSAAINYANELQKKVVAIKQTILNANNTTTEMMTEIQAIEKDLDIIIFAFNGLRPKASYEEIPPHMPSISRRLNYVVRAHYNSTAAITQTEKDQLAIVEEQMPGLIEKLREIGTKDIVGLEKKLDNAGVPWTSGRLPEWK